MRLKRHVYILGASLLLAVTVSQAADTGTLIVKATEKSGSPMPGVVVELSNSKGLTVPAPKVTDGTGTANFLLPPGQGYSVKVTLPGFTPQTQEFDLGMGKTKTILFQMSQQMEVTVHVKAKVVELDEGGENKVAFTDNFVEDLPILGRSYQNVLTLAPGVNDANGDGNPNVHGSRERDFKATVDGVSNVDPLTGTFMSNINPDAIEEIEVVTTGASAEYGGAVGGFGKIITKQGTNAFDGNASIYIRSSLFDGNTVTTGTDQEKVAYHDVRPTLNFTGPVVKDKLFFALFHEYIDRGEPLNLVGGGRSVVVNRKGSRNLDKLTWQVSPRNKLVFQTQADPLRLGPLAVDALTDPASGVDLKQGGPTYQLHWDAQVSSVLSLQSLIGAQHTGIDLIPVSEGARNSCGVDADARIGRRLDPFGRPGGEPIDEDYCLETKTSRRTGSYFERYADDRIRYTVRSDASYFLENFLGVSHTLRGGIIAEKKRYEAQDTLRSFSIFDQVQGATFGGLDNIVGPGGGILARQLYLPGLPDTTDNKADGSGYGIFLDDQFRPHPNVSLRIGFRVDKENMSAEGFKHFDPAAESAQFQANWHECADVMHGDPDQCARANWHFFHKYESYPVIGNAQFKQIIQDPQSRLMSRETDRIRISNTNVAPRLNISWDPGTNGKTKIFATAGRYYGETFLLIPIYEQPSDSFIFTYQVISNEATNFTPTIASDADARISAASIRQVDRNLRTSYQDEYTVGFSREIFQETSITLTAIKRKYRDQFQDIDINHYAQDLGNVNTAGCHRVPADGPLVPIDPHPDGVFDDCGGRSVPRLGPPPFFRPEVVEVPDGIPDLFVNNPFFNQINLVGNFNESDYKAYQFEIKRRLHRNWELEASYVWSKATGNAEDYMQTLGNDPTTIQDEFGYLGYDQRHVVKVNVRTQLPLWNVRLSSAFSWETGEPYSITEERVSSDGVRKFGRSTISYNQLRTIFPTHQRNDQRNEAYWLFDIGARKDFTVGKTNLETSLDIINVLNNDALHIDSVRNGLVVAERHTGRQFQLGAKITF